MRPLVIGGGEEKKLADLREFAEANPISLVTVMESIGKPERAPGDDPRRHCMIPWGFRVAFTIEQHPGGWYRHASFSVEGKRGAVPNTYAIAMMAEKLGFKQTDKYDGFYIENERDPHPAVNVLEKMEGYEP